MTDELTMLRQFRDSVADISLSAPKGANGAQWAAQRLRELRRVARIYRDQSNPALLDALSPREDAVGGGDLARVVETWRAIMADQTAPDFTTEYTVEATDLRLLIDHASHASPTPAVEGIPAGMVEWEGGDSAPEDWNGGPVMLRGGWITDPSKVSLIYHPQGSRRWDHKRENGRPERDIVAYTPKDRPTASDGEARERIAREMLAQAFEDAGVTGYARHILSGRCDWNWTRPALDAILAALPTTDGGGRRLARRLLEQANLIAGVEHEGTVSVMREAADWMLATPPTTDASERMREAEA